MGIGVGEGALCCSSVGQRLLGGVGKERKGNQREADFPPVSAVAKSSAWWPKYIPVELGQFGWEGTAGGLHPSICSGQFGCNLGVS